MKYSLHIGLNSVNPAHYGGWNGRLHGCHNDADAMASIALERGVKQCYMLLSQEATIQKVIDAIHNLYKLAVCGDTVLISYSGHGGQYPDRSGDEADGLDETWCLYDGELIDDDLRRLLSKFDTGVNVIVVSDSCHSGTVTKRRTLDLQMGDVKCAPFRTSMVASKSSTPEQEASCTRTRPRMRASVLLLSGCQDNQFSFDGPQNGAFTAALLAIYAGGTFKGGYRAFRKAIVGIMPPNQTPALTITGAKNKAFEEGEVFQ
jgi:hypothetical protein